MKKYDDFKYGLLFLGTVLYFLIMFSIAVPLVKKEREEWTKREVAKWDSVFHIKRDCNCDCK